MNGLLIWIGLLLIVFALWVVVIWRGAQREVQEQIHRVPGKCFVCGKPATGSYRLAKPTCTEHGRAFYDLLLAEGKRQTAERECRRKVVAVLAFAPQMPPEEVAKTINRKLETVKTVMAELATVNGNGVRHGA